MDPEEIEAALEGVAHREDAIREAISRFNLSDYISNIRTEELLEGFI
jgi:hypothetical protein